MTFIVSVGNLRCENWSPEIVVEKIFFAITEKSGTGLWVNKI